MIDENRLEAMIKSEDSFKCEGEFYHCLTLTNGALVTNSSPLSPAVAGWNARIRLQILVENSVPDFIELYQQQ